MQDGAESQRPDAAFIETHRDFVRGIARRLSQLLHLTMPVADLEAYGYTGLLEARERFDAERGARFRTFAYYRVRGAMIDGIREQAYLSRGDYARLRAIEALNARQSDALADEDREQLDAHRVMESAAEGAGVAYVLACFGEHSAAQGRGADDILAERDQNGRLRALLGELDERERALVERHYFQGEAFDSVAESLGISKSWGSRIHHRALEKLRRAMLRAR